ncbi:hypothetical protein CLU79DRAFT_830289 [Phycomyces nitens]|nr:hypothetical protein CLU79DRAFT_830289 [Phycomyces nitens]
MSGNSVNNNPNNLKFVEGNLEPSAKRGKLNDVRKLACIEAMLEYRPFEQLQGNVIKAWEMVQDKVNKSDPMSHPVGISTIRNFVRDSRKQIKEKHRRERGDAGTNDPETSLENRILSLDQLMTVVELKKSKDDEDPAQSIARKRDSYQNSSNVSNLSPRESLEKDIALAMEADERERARQRKLANEMMKVMLEIKKELCEVKQELRVVNERLEKLEESSRSSHPSAYQQPSGTSYPSFYLP